ncbi:hypothetical protein C5167_031606 [Papaver somniferum]|uniref:non-specific serine/threonine protein kinase n=1 Tax=Papaver somniferum TaxID=3469 RepID=A0A4Y7K815_PAPSO|nr:hypothetical protein C5167_031606 [Papaver somniferum]
MSDNGGSSDGNETTSGKTPPSGSDTSESPPSPDSSKSSPDSPPSDSKNSPSDSGKSSPSPDTPPDSENSSPPPPPPPESDSSPPPDSNGENPPPSDSNNDSEPSKSSPPPPSDKDKTPSDSYPAPKSSNDSPPKSDKGGKSSPPSSDNRNDSPNNDNHNSPPGTPDSPPPRDGTQSNRSSSHVPELSGPSTHSSRTPSTQIDIGAVVGVTVAGVLIFGLIALCFAITRKKKKRPLEYDPYGASPPNYSGNSGYYNGPHSQQHLIAGMPGGYSQEYYSGGRPGGHSQEYHNGGRPSAYPNSGPINSYGSYKGPDSGTLMSGAQSSFTYDDLMGITEGFARKNVIGEGGFGAVYKGYLPDGRTVAVKQLKAGSGQGEREFRAEVDIISRVHHRHLVSLVGYCIADAQRLLVYEFVPNNTLEHHIHNQGLPVLDWSKRVKIAIGSARGLAYLHEDFLIYVDFRYMAPEYASSGKLTDRSDVFSFGVVLLELVTGRRPIDPSLQDESLVEWVRPLIASAIETGDFSELVDSRLENRYVESEMFKMAETAAACVRHSATKRPRMVQVLRALDTDGDMPDINNGVKVGQSTIFEANSDLQKFRMLALGGNDSADYSTYSGSVNSRANILPPKPPPGWSG